VLDGLRRIIAPRRPALRSERGQVLLMFVAIFTVLLAVAVIAIDQGVWLGERRISQKDADTSTRWAAFAFVTGRTAAHGADAEQRARDTAEANLADLAHEDFDVIIDLNECRDYNDNLVANAPSVRVQIGEDTGALFGRLFGVAGITVGAEATACVGSLNAAKGLRPWAIPITSSECFEHDGTKYQPLFGATCIIRHDDNPAIVGSVRLDPPEETCNQGNPDPGNPNNPGNPGNPGNPQDSGANTYRCNIEYGTGTVYEVGDGVLTEPGFNTGPTLDGIERLLADEGDCDAEYGHLGVLPGIDEFDESLVQEGGASDPPGPGVVYFRRDCETPRLVNVVLVNQLSTDSDDCTADPPGGGVQCLEIVGFAAFFLEGCEADRNDGTVVFSPVCYFGPGATHVPGANANFRIVGRFVNLVELGGMIGDFDEPGLRVVTMVR
jgi:hypothetical protein